MALTKRRTPVGVYPSGSGKVGGTLRRNWSVKFYDRGGRGFEAVIYNSTYYAPYVEYGHRKRGGRGWVEGRFMLTKAEEKIVRDAPAIIAKELRKILNG